MSKMPCHMQKVHKLDHHNLHLMHFNCVPQTGRDYLLRDMPIPNIRPKIDYDLHAMREWMSVMLERHLLSDLQCNNETVQRRLSGFVSFLVYLRKHNNPIMPGMSVGLFDLLKQHQMYDLYHRFHICITNKYVYKMF